MTTCLSCGYNVTGKKFCPQCGTAVYPANAASESNQITSANCPRCGGEVRPGAAFCGHCGSTLTAQAISATPMHPTTQTCPACHAQVPIENAFCISCGQNLRSGIAQQNSVPGAMPSPAFCTNCGRQNAPGVHFCAACGSAISATPMAQPGYGQYAQQYGQASYQQQPMVLRCPICMAITQLGTSTCPGCHNSLVGVAPTPANMPVQGQQGVMGGLGGMLQGSGGKMAMGALGGAAAVIGGEMLLHGLEENIENRVEGDMGYGHRHHHREEGLLGGLGDLANDIGLF
ncbi:MAG: zinc ribbon domain-containing protein [Chloroflexi bacterium]|nr:zinc ribbon domain-containing protein [Ktedonobacteraceae bacterium]MBV9707514.1 zinc ribbon domain-containing protein [Chloroflexota bacterium]